MNNTILFSPSNEQLLEIATQDPELNSRIKSSIIKELEKGAIKFINSQVQSNARSAYASLSKEVEGKFFTAADYWKSTPAKFNKELEAQFTNQISEKLKEQLEKEFNAYLESNEFKVILKNKLRDKVVEKVLLALDEQIEKEAKKIIN